MSEDRIASERSDSKKGRYILYRVTPEFAGVPTVSGPGRKTLATMEAATIQDQPMDPEAMQARIAERKKEEQRQKEEEEARLAANDLEVQQALAAGKEAFAAGDFDTAEKKFDLVLFYPNTTVSGRPEILCNRAACLLKLGRFADAVCDASNATDLEPNFAKAHYRLACAHKGMGQILKARKACRAALELLPDSAQLKSMLEELEATDPASVAPPPAAAPAKKPEKSAAEREAIRARVLQMHLESSAARATEADPSWEMPGPSRIGS